MCYAVGVTETPTKLKFTKVEAGFYATEDGKWAVVVDGYEKSEYAGADGGFDSRDKLSGGYEGFPGGEWAAVYSATGGLREDAGAGTNLDWFATKREAVAFAEYKAREGGP